MLFKIILLFFSLIEFDLFVIEFILFLSFLFSYEFIISLFLYFFFKLNLFGNNILPLSSINNFSLVVKNDFGLLYYNKTNGTVTKTTLKPLTNYPVDLTVVYAAIEIVSSDNESHQLHPKYFSIIFKLLKDKVLGTGYEDVKATYFRQELMKDYKTEGRSSFSKYLPHGFYPNWYYEESQFTSDKKKHIKEALEFAEKFKTTYDDIRFKNNVNCTEKVETAEETAE